MRSTKTNVSAILAGEQRSARFRCRHSVAAAAKEVGIPASWIWSWLLAKRLESQLWLRKVWVRLDDVQRLLADPLALRDAFYATGEFLTSTDAIRQVAERCPDEPHPYLRVQLPPKMGVRSAKPDPVLREEEGSKVVA